MTVSFSEKLQNHVFVIAEMANAHEGQLHKAKLIFEQACATGADAVKIQLYFASELLSRTHERYAHFEKMEMPQASWQELIAYAHDKGLQVFADVFGMKSAEQAVALNVDGFKVHSADTFNWPLLEFLNQQGKTVLLSCGGTKLIELKWALERLQTVRQNGNLVLMHGFQNFPTKLQDSNLSWIREFEQQFKLPIGFMDHLDAEDPLAVTLPLLGVSAGARVVEKHITDDRSRKGIDYYSSLHGDEFKSMVSQIRRIETALGRSDMKMSEDEQEYRKKMKKMLVAKRDLPAGHTLTLEDLDFKRSQTLGNSLYLNEALGQTLQKPIQSDEVLNYTYFKNNVGVLIAVRMHSTRFPQKAIKQIQGQTTTEHLIDRLKLSKLADKVVLCTSDEALDDPLPPLAEAKGIPFVRGSGPDVMARFFKAVERFGFNHVIRITGDDILIDPVHLDKAIAYHLERNNDFTMCLDLPSGTEGEVISVAALKRALELAEDSSHSEYMRYYLENEQFFRVSHLPIEEKYKKKWRLTIDHAEDFEVVKSILDNIYSPEKPYTLDDMFNYIQTNEHILKINSNLRKKDVPHLNTRLSLYK